MSSVECLVTLLIIFSIIPNDLCSRIRLIQPLDTSTGFSYVVVSDGKYHMIAGDVIVSAVDLPNNISDQELKAVMVYYNQYCNPTQNNLVVLKARLENGEIKFFNTNLSLTNWNNDTQWSQESKGLPTFLSEDPIPLSPLFNVDFTMQWHQRKELYIIQRPIGGSFSEFDYRCIAIEKSCYGLQYMKDQENKIVDILSPYSDFESCFIHNNTQIVCYGFKQFTAFDIDLDKTKDGKISVKGVNKNFPVLPIMKIIQNLTPIEDLDSTPIGSDVSTAEPDGVTEPLTSSSKPLEKESNSMVWIIVVLIILVVIVLVIIWFFCCKKKDNMSQKSVAPTDPTDPAVPSVPMDSGPQEVKVETNAVPTKSDENITVRSKLK